MSRTTSLRRMARQPDSAGPLSIFWANGTSAATAGTELISAWTSLGREVADFQMRRARRCAEATREVFGARDVGEAMRIQWTFARDTVEACGAEAQRVSAAMVDLIGKAGGRLRA